MDVSKMRARMKMRKVAGQQVARQDRTSKAFAKAEAEAKNAPYAGESGIDVEGNKPRPRLDRPARASGGRVCRADGGVTISEDSKKEAKRLRAEGEADSHSAGPTTMKSALPAVAGGALLGAMTGGKGVGMRIGQGLGGLGVLGGTIEGGKKLVEGYSKRAEARRIERGQAEPGKEDRKRGGRVARDKDCD